MWILGSVIRKIVKTPVPIIVSQEKVLLNHSNEALDRIGYVGGTSALLCFILLILLCIGCFLPLVIPQFIIGIGFATTLTVVIVMYGIDKHLRGRRC